MKTVQDRVIILIVASMLVLPAVASAQTNSSRQRADKFREVEALLQRESSNSPILGTVDRTAAPADPVPSAVTKDEKRARFVAEERALQRASTNMAPSSPPVDRTQTPADSFPKATTRSAKRERFIEQEKTLQSETP